MSEKRSRRDLGDGTDNEDDDLDDDARDSVDLDAETEAQQRRDMARIQAGWNQRVDLMRQTITSLQDPTVVRAMQMILNMGLVSPTTEFMDILQLGMRDIEEKQRQEEERRRQRRFLGEEPVEYSPPSPRYDPPSPTARARDEAEFNMSMDALAIRSQEEKKSSFFFGSSARDVVDLVDDDEESEEKKREQARLFSLYQPPRNNAPRLPTILQRLDEIKGREEKKSSVANPSPLSQANINVPSSLFGSSESKQPQPQPQPQQHPLYQDVIASDESIADRIRAHFARNNRPEEKNEVEAEVEAEAEAEHRDPRLSDFDWDDVVPPSPIPEDADDDDDDEESSSDSSDDEE